MVCKHCRLNGAAELKLVVIDVADAGAEKFVVAERIFCSKGDETFIHYELRIIEDSRSSG